MSLGSKVIEDEINSTPNDFFDARGNVDDFNAAQTVLAYIFRCAAEGFENKTAPNHAVGVVHAGQSRRFRISESVPDLSRIQQEIIFTKPTKNPKKTPPNMIKKKTPSLIDPLGPTENSSPPRFVTEARTKPKPKPISVQEINSRIPLPKILISVLIFDSSEASTSLAATDFTCTPNLWRNCT